MWFWVISVGLKVTSAGDLLADPGPGGKQSHLSEEQKPIVGTYLLKTENQLTFTDLWSRV